MTLTAVGEEALIRKSGGGASVGKTRDETCDESPYVSGGVIRKGRMIRVVATIAIDAADFQRDGNRACCFTELKLELDKMRVDGHFFGSAFSFLWLRMFLFNC